jgi:hypothetical protein
MKGKALLIDYKIPKYAETKLWGHVKAYKHFENGIGSYKYFSVEFGKDHQPVSTIDYDYEMKIINDNSYLYYKYGLYGDEIYFRCFDAEFDSIVEHEDRIIKKTKYLEYIYYLDSLKRIIRKEEYDIGVGNKALVEATEFMYLPNKNAKSVLYYRYNNISFLKKLNFERKNCIIVEKEYDSIGRCISMKEFSFSIDEKEKNSLESLDNKPEYVSGEIYIYDTDTISIFPVTFTFNKFENKYNFKFCSKMLTDLNWRLLQNGDCDIDGNFINSTRYFYNQANQLIKCELIKNDFCYYTPKNEYDELGNVIFVDASPNDKIEYKYEFDENNNWILRTDIMNGKKFGSIKREITYYK